MGAKRLGFTAVRFNTGVADVIEGTARGDVIPEPNWAILDQHIQRCKMLGHDIVLTMIPPDSEMATGWESTRLSSPTRFIFDTNDEAFLADLYSQIVGRILVANSFPSEKLFVEIANEASLAADGGVYSGIPLAPDTGEIQPDYLSALGLVANTLKARFPDVLLLTHAFAFNDATLVETMSNPWTTEFEPISASPPSHLQVCDIVNVHIYYTYKLRYRIQTANEYQARTVKLFADFVEMLRSQAGAEWDVVKRKPIWITETGASYKFTGMSGIAGQEWGNSTELSLFRVMPYDALVYHPDCQAAFEYTMRNEVFAYDDRDHDFNEGILLNGDADLPILYTPSYKLFGYSNGVEEPEIPLDYEPAPEPSI